MEYEGESQENDDSYQRPLSPVLTHSNRSVFLSKRKRMKSRVKLANRFSKDKENENTSKGNVSVVSNESLNLSQEAEFIESLKIFEKIEDEQCTTQTGSRLYEEDNNANFKKPSSPAPIARKIKQAQDLESTKFKGFQTAAGKNIQISSSVSQSQALFDDILNPLKTRESRSNKYSFLAKAKPDHIKDKTNVVNLTENNETTNLFVADKFKTSNKQDCIPKQHNDENLYASFLISQETDQLFSNITLIENQIAKTHASDVINELVPEKPKMNEAFKGFDENSIEESNRIAATMINQFRITHKTHNTCSKRTSQEVHNDCSDQKRFKCDSVMSKTSSSLQKLKSVPHNSTTIKQSLLNNLHKKNPSKEKIEIVSSREGFQFASGNPVCLSQKALEQAASKLLDSAENIEIYNSKSSVFPNSSKSITESSLKRVTDISKRNDLSCSTSSNDFDKLEKEKITASSGGFQFASGNSVYLSEEALEIASVKLLADAENLTADSQLKRIDKIFDKTDLKTIQTPTISLNKSIKRTSAANDEIVTGNKVSRSVENALEEVAAQLLESAESKTIDNSSLPSSSKCITQSLNLDSEKNEITATSKGFQLASGNSVYVSEDALKRASAILLEDAANAELRNTLKSSTSFTETVTKVDFNKEQSSTIHLDDGIDKTFTPSEGFQLASGNVANISEEALKTAKDLSKNEENVLLDRKSNSSTVFPGFSYNPIQPSLKRAIDIFKGIDLSPELFDPSLNFNKIKKGRDNRFAPGNAVQRAKEIFKGIDLSPDFFNPSLNNFNKKGRNSSGKNIMQDNLSTKQSSVHTTDLNTEAPISRTLNNFHDPRILKSVDGFQTASTSSVQLSHNALMSDIDNMLKNEDDVKHLLSNNSFKSGNEQSSYKDAKSSTLSTSLIDSLESTSKDNTHILEEVNLAEKGKLNTSRRKLNQRKRLGITPCKPVYTISSNKLEKCKLFFEDDKSLGHSPSKSNEPLIFNSTPSKHFSNIPLEPDITPIKNINDTTALEQEQENFLDNRVILQECTKGDVKAWTESLECERFRLEMKIKVIILREEALNRQKYVLQNSTPDYRRRRTGILFNKKQIGKEFQLQNFVKPNSLQHQFSCITPQNAERLHFNYAEEKVPYINTEDGASVIPNVKDLVGLSEIEMAFRTMPGIEPRLIPTGWISNHFKWIVWKLASYERYASNLQGALTLENVIQQLKYRYDREIDKAERSALRKILEKDDVPQKRMVLCVSNIFNVANGTFELELTDGWYCIRTVIDQPLCAQINLQKIKIGTKLIICGAELLNCDGCHPLEATDMVRLKICYNSTRRALWHAKLGYQRWVEPFPLTLSSLLPDGGIVGCIKVYIARLYPVKYLERENKRTVWRNKKAEEIRAQNWENERSSQIEEIREIVRKECERSQNKKHLETNLNDSDIKNINCPETLYNLYKKSRDPERLHEMLSQSQINSIMEHQRRSSFALQQEINREVEERVTKLPERDVTPMQQMLVIDTLDPQEKRSVLQIWRPLEAHVQLLKESAVFYVYNVLPKKNGLSSTSRTKFQALTGEFPQFDRYKRVLTPISLLNNSVNRPMFNEFDTVGIVVEVSVNNFEQSLWLADVCGSLLFVKVFEGPKNCSLLDSKSGQLVAVSNLVLTDSKFEFAEAIANHSTTVSRYPKQKHLQDGINKFNEQCSEGLKSFLADCNQRITHYVDKINLSRSCNSRSNSFVQSNTLNSCEDFDESCDETTLTQSRITSTDVALSLIDIDTIASNNN